MDSVTVEKKTALYWLWLSFFIIVADQVSKYLITSNLFYGESIYLMPILNFTLAHNKGAAFSFLSEMGNFAVWFFVIIALIISFVLSIWMYRLPFKHYWLAVSLALILGGAIGNLLDRIMLGYVIDFVHFHLEGWSFPVFNIADVAITFGALMLIVDIFKKKKV